MRQAVRLGIPRPFVAQSPPPPPVGDLAGLRASLGRWVDGAQRAGLDDEAIGALVADALRGSGVSRVA